MSLTARSTRRIPRRRCSMRWSLLATASTEDRSHATRSTLRRSGAHLSRPSDHPGVAHYLIHAYDSAELAQRGLSAARAYSKSRLPLPMRCTCIAHFHALGLWDDSMRPMLLRARPTARVMWVKDSCDGLLTYAYLQRGRQGMRNRL